MYERAALVANTVGEDSGYLKVGWGWYVGCYSGCWQVESWMDVSPGGGVNGFDFSDAPKRQDTR